MEESPNGYHLSFFKPTTPQARANRNMVSWLVSVWFIAVFGFQILLLVLEEPTPEPAYVNFEKARINIENDIGSPEVWREFGKSILSVLGKTAISSEERLILDKAFSWSVYQLVPPSSKEELISDIESFKKLESSAKSISDPVYMEAKNRMSAKYSPLLDLSLHDIRSKFLPLELISANHEMLSKETWNDLSTIMKKYLIHNQSFLTDLRFLGFPFHYFYTANFLLVLFIGLCWIYCIKTDNRNVKLNMED